MGDQKAVFMHGEKELLLAAFLTLGSSPYNLPPPTQSPRRNTLSDVRVGGGTSLSPANGKRLVAGKEDAVAVARSTESDFQRVGGRRMERDVAGESPNPLDERRAHRSVRHGFRVGIRRYRRSGNRDRPRRGGECRKGNEDGRVCGTWHARNHSGGL